MTFYPNGSQTIVPGDILTENSSTSNPVGHTAIITSVNLNGSGTGTIDILEQNDSPSGSRSLHVTNWNVDPDAYSFGQTIQGWLHANANNGSGGGEFSKTSPANGATEVDPTNVTLSWNAAGSNPYGYDQKYKYCLYTSGETCGFTGNIYTTQYTVAGLTAGTTYFWQVEVVNCTTAACGSGEKEFIEADNG